MSVLNDIGDYRYSPEYQIIMKAAMKSYSIFVKSLPEDYQEVINLRWDGCTRDEIRDITGFSNDKIDNISKKIKEILDSPCNKDIKDDLFDLINLPYGKTRTVCAFKNSVEKC